MYSCKTELFEMELTTCIKIDLALNNLQMKSNQPTNHYLFSMFSSFYSFIFLLPFSLIFLSSLEFSSFLFVHFFFLHLNVHLFSSIFSFFFLFMHLSPYTSSYQLFVFHVCALEKSPKDITVFRFFFFFVLFFLWQELSKYFPSCSCLFRKHYFPNLRQIDVR